MTDVRLKPAQAVEVAKLIQLNALRAIRLQRPVPSVLLTQQGDNSVVVAFTTNDGLVNVSTHEVSGAGVVFSD